MTKRKKVWVIRGVSESGDHYGPVIYNSKPSDGKLKKLCGDWDAGEWDGPGDYNSYIHLEVEEREVEN